MTRATTGAAWPDLISPEARRAARSRIMDRFVKNGSSGNTRRGYSSCFFLPHPSHCQRAVVGQCLPHGPTPGAAPSPAWSQPPSRQPVFSIADVVPTSETVRGTTAMHGGIQRKDPSALLFRMIRESIWLGQHGILHGRVNCNAEADCPAAVWRWGAAKRRGTEIIASPPATSLKSVAGRSPCTGKK